ncbi:MAG: 2-amino-4-hydroxy-6-hydroxymethyldihydropteridine diphosphokinase [SAR324 cluster bacterium]|nr:2-amino-4-hydroxy-6-hydroxymethyldihydropteridine diphosphokinase [SAR324 cluster bacterium]MBL7034998.1 2-amino-4-hydroxy-6-hydroxymethyldihydropteridine diphosphokinase [SAR324 cluster bacterium]
MTEAILVHLGLGSNLGNRLDLLKQACAELKSLPLQQFRVSSIFESEPLLKMPQPKYLNLVLCGLTMLSPFELLNKCQKIENKLGRVRNERWGSRTIDIDILAYADEIIDKDNLRIPHPELEKRSFVLLPLLELNPAWEHPKTGVSIRMLWQNWQQTNDEEVPQRLQ